MPEKPKDQEEIEIEKKANEMPDNQRNYYLENFKNKFYKETMLDNKMLDDLQKDRLIEIFKVKNTFPTTYKLQEIIKVKKFVRSAIDVAIWSLQNLMNGLKK